MLYTHMCAWLAYGRESDGHTVEVACQMRMARWRGGGAVLRESTAISHLSLAFLNAGTLKTLMVLAGQMSMMVTSKSYHMC